MARESLQPPSTGRRRGRPLDPDKARALGAASGRVRRERADREALQRAAELEPVRWIS